MDVRFVRVLDSDAPFWQVFARFLAWSVWGGLNCPGVCVRDVAYSAMCNAYWVIGLGADDPGCITGHGGGRYAQWVLGSGWLSFPGVYNLYGDDKASGRGWLVVGAGMGEAAMFVFAYWGGRISLGPLGFAFPCSKQRQAGFG